MFAEINELREKVMFLMDCELTTAEKAELRSKAVDLAIELAKAKVENSRKLAELQARKTSLEAATEEFTEILGIAAEYNLFGN